MKSALVVDDEKTQRTMVSAILEDQLGMDVIQAENGADALKILSDPKASTIKLVTLDIDMPVMTGLEALPRILKKFPDLPVIMVTGTASIESAAQAMKLGATDFFSKPVNAQRIVASAQNALKIGLLKKEVTRLEKQTNRTLLFDDLIGANGTLKPLINIAAKAASSDVPVLITGETGVGKEVFARAIHGESQRAGKPFIAVNCGAIPEKLAESTLFGHEKGAFTGAINNALGKFREAEGGTIFLDEVGELPLETQVKLLRVLQEQEIEPVGAGKALPINIRVISATNRDLDAQVHAGRFREDLYFRLNVLPLHVPPLRERKADIPNLATFFIDQFSTKDQSLHKGITKNAMANLKAYRWPGNVRELENTISRSLLLCDNDELDAQDIIFCAKDGIADDAESTEKIHSIAVLKQDGSLKTIAEIEQSFFDFALTHCEGSVAKAAKAIGIAKSTLYRKLNNKD